MDSYIFSSSDKKKYRCGTNSRFKKFTDQYTFIPYKSLKYLGRGTDEHCFEKSFMAVSFPPQTVARFWIDNTALRNPPWQYLFPPANPGKSQVRDFSAETKNDCKQDHGI